MSAAATEDALQQEPRQQAVDEDGAPLKKDLSIGALSTILAAIDTLKSVIVDNEVRIVKEGREREEKQQQH